MAAHGILFFGETIIPRCHADDFFNKDQQPLVSDLISFDSISIDARVQKSFALAVNAVQEGVAVSLTAIGRKVSHFSDTSEKHAIKRVDRLIGYEKLADARNCFYKQFCGYFSGQKNPLILED